MITLKELKRRVEYNPINGLFTHRIRVGRSRAGVVATRHDNYGYICIGMAGVIYRAHRLAFLYMDGKLLSKSVDHINGVKDDNRWVNLRYATISENKRNIGPYKNNTSGYKGVHLEKTTKKWVAYITHSGKRHHIGMFTCKHEAAKAYNIESKKHHGEFGFQNHVEELRKDLVG